MTYRSPSLDSSAQRSAPVWPGRIRIGRLARSAALALGLAGFATPAGADVIFGQLQSTFTKDGTEHTVCLGVSGTPVAGADLMAVSCDAPAPVWSVKDWSSSGVFKIAYGPHGDTRTANSSICLDVDTAHPTTYEEAGLYFCHPSASPNTDWTWAAQAGRTRPNQTVILRSNGKCLVPDVVGTELNVGPCSGASPWVMLAAPTLEPVDGTIEHTRTDGTKVCLDINGPPAAGVRVIAGNCTGGAPWHVKTWAPSSPLTRIGYGLADDDSGLCLADNSARPGRGDFLTLQDCDDITNLEGLFNWEAVGSRADRPNREILQPAANACVVPIEEGEDAVVQACNEQTQRWTLGPLPRIDEPEGQILKSSGTFTAPETATYRVLAIGGGGGGGYDEGAGGGSGSVTYGDVHLDTGEEVTVTIGAGGYAGTSTAGKQDGGDGAATTFGSHLSASGGKGGAKNNGPGGDGGSGGGGDPGNGGSDGSAGGRGGDTSGGSGQGAAFADKFCRILKFDLTAGVGGASGGGNGQGGGGGGGLQVGSETTAGAGNAAGSAAGGTGYGGGGAGGSGFSGPANRAGGAGAAGLLIVEWGGEPPSHCN